MRYSRAFCKVLSLVHFKRPRGTNCKLLPVEVPEPLHVYYVLLGKQSTLFQSRGILSCFCGEVYVDENVVEHGYLVVVGNGAFDYGFMEVSEVAVGFGRVVFHRLISLLADFTIEE